MAMTAPQWQPSAGRCRYCGEPESGSADFGSGCRRCGGSPLCDRCGHARKEHRGLFGGGGQGCRERLYDFESLSASDCSCEGYLARTRNFAEAEFAAPPDEGEQDFPPLRLA